MDKWDPIIIETQMEKRYGWVLAQKEEVVGHTSDDERRMRKPPRRRKVEVHWNEKWRQNQQKNVGEQFVDIVERSATQTLSGALESQI